MLKCRWAVLFLAGCLLPVWGTPSLAQKKGKEPSAEFTRDNPKVRAAFREVVAKASPSTLRVLCDGKETALGVVVGPDGWILTKASDLHGKVSCRLKDGREFPARVVGWEDKHDVALLKIEVASLPAVALAESKTAAVGHWVACAGPGPEPVAIGIVGVATRNLPPRPMLPTPPPNSGYLGVGLEPGDGGVRIMQVLPGTAAAQAGLKVGDLIISLNGKMVAVPEDFIGGVQKLKVGDQVTLKIRREKEKPELEIKATLGKRPPNRGDFQNIMGSELSKRRSGFPIVLQHDAVIKPVDCGSPLLDLDGRVIGINICRAGRTESWAIPGEVIKPLLVDLMAGKLPPPKMKELAATPPFGEQMAAAETVRQKLAKDLADATKKLADARGELAKQRLHAEALKLQLDKALGELKKYQAAPKSEPPSKVAGTPLASQADQVLNLMGQRLNVMATVARWKWGNRPIEDPKREEELLQQLVAQAREQKQDEAFTRHFFRGQMEAAKLLQRNLFIHWEKTKTPPFANVPDLTKSLRPEIDRISAELRRAVEPLRSRLGEPGLQQYLKQLADIILTGEGIDERVRAAALRVLQKEK